MTVSAHSENTVLWSKQAVRGWQLPFILQRQIVFTPLAFSVAFSLTFFFFFVASLYLRTSSMATSSIAGPSVSLRSRLPQFNQRLVPLPISFRSFVCVFQFCYSVHFTILFCTNYLCFLLRMHLFAVSVEYLITSFISRRFYVSSICSFHVTCTWSINWLCGLGYELFLDAERRCRCVQILLNYSMHALTVFAILIWLVSTFCCFL